MLLHLGEDNVAAYTDTFGPDTFGEDASIRRFGREGACTKAILNALNNIVDEVRGEKYQGAIMIRSFLKDQWAQEPQHFECDVSGSSAEVVLLATLARFPAAPAAAK
ncbi:MAG: hypothetical protein QM776_09355 [Rhodocyclaceae bacterium]